MSNKHLSPTLAVHLESRKNNFIYSLLTVLLPSCSVSTAQGLLN